jgi:clan AA aspartic protease
MGTVFAQITLQNAADVVNAEDGIIREEEIRSLDVTAIVDSGAYSLVINEEQCQKLGLRIYKEQTARLADGRRVTCKVAAPVKICWKDRETSCDAMIIPGAETVLLGSLPLEAMDLMIHPAKQELVGVHGDIMEQLVL